MHPEKIKAIKCIGKQKTRDIEVDHPLHRFYANGLVTSNSHAISYAMFSAWQLYLKAHYFDEFMTVCLNAVDRTKEKKGIDILDSRVKYAIRKGTNLYPPDINKSKEYWTLNDTGIRAGLSGIKTIGKDASLIVEHQPYKNTSDFLDKTKLGKGKFEALLFAGVFDDFDERGTLFNWYHNVYRKKKEKPEIGLEQMSLFLLEPDEIDDIVSFTKSDLKAAEYGMLGFSIPENILRKFQNELEQNKKWKTVGEVEKLKVRYPLMFGQVQKYYNLVSPKSGNDWTYVTLSDGLGSMEIMVSTAQFAHKKRYFQIGNVLVVPVALWKDDETGELQGGRCMLSDGKETIKIIDTL